MAKVVLHCLRASRWNTPRNKANKEMEGATRVLINTVIGMYDKLANRTVEVDAQKSAGA